jgi:hypothetical protein
VSFSKFPIHIQLNYPSCYKTRRKLRVFNIMSILRNPLSSLRRRILASSKTRADINTYNRIYDGRYCAPFSNSYDIITNTRKFISSVSVTNKDKGEDISNSSNSNSSSSSSSSSSSNSNSNSKSNTTSQIQMMNHIWIDNLPIIISPLFFRIEFSLFRTVLKQRDEYNNQ